MPEAEATAQVSDHPIRVEKSLLARAIKDDVTAIETMFRQFVGADERMLYLTYLGIEGLWGFGTKSFGCVTNRRAASLRVGKFGEVIYQDGLLEHSNSGVVLQPSKLLLYIFVVLSSIASIAVCGFAQSGFWYLERRARYYRDEGITLDYGFDRLLEMALIALLLIVGPLTFPAFWYLAAKLYYRFVKCGLVVWIREGVSVYWFANRKLITRANGLYRAAFAGREAFLASNPSRSL